MKKLLALILVLVLCLPAMALADVLADDWQDASMEELLDAQQNISNRISELRAAAAADVERVELSGTGTAILSDVVIPFAPSRVKLTSEGSCTAKLTGGAYDYVFDGDSYEEKFFDQSGTFALTRTATLRQLFPRDVHEIVAGSELVAVEILAHVLLSFCLPFCSACGRMRVEQWHSLFCYYQTVRGSANFSGRSICFEGHCNA